MPSCIHTTHAHPVWPDSGPLTVCSGERTCGYCPVRRTPANYVFKTAHALRTHVYEQHVDGGKMDRQNVVIANFTSMLSMLWRLGWLADKVYL